MPDLFAAAVEAYLLRCGVAGGGFKRERCLAVGAPACFRSPFLPARDGGGALVREAAPKWCFSRALGFKADALETEPEARPLPLPPSQRAAAGFPSYSEPGTVALQWTLRRVAPLTAEEAAQTEPAPFQLDLCPDGEATGCY